MYGFSNSQLYVLKTVGNRGRIDMVQFPGGHATIDGTAVTFHYYTQDYLGNNRAVINGTTGAIEQTTAYYPYGGVIADLGTGNSGQPFRFGGKELITANGLNEYDFGARRQYSAVPHFTSIDPLCESYRHISPYLYCGNDLVNSIDPTGEGFEGSRCFIKNNMYYRIDQYENGMVIFYSNIPLKIAEIANKIIDSVVIRKKNKNDSPIKRYRKEISTIYRDIDNACFSNGISNIAGKTGAIEKSTTYSPPK